LSFFHIHADGWDTKAKRIGHIRKKCVATFRGYSVSVTCMAIAELSKERRRLLSSLDGSKDGFRTKIHLGEGGDDEGTIFLTGSSDGSARLWNSLTGRCLQLYVAFISKDSTESITITSIAHLSTDLATPDDLHNRELFVCGHKSGKMRMWNMLDGLCLAVFDQHVGMVHSICALGSSEGFASAGQDGTIKVWRTTRSSYDRDPRKIDVGKQSFSLADEIPSLSISSSSLDNIVGPKAHFNPRTKMN